MPEAETVAPPVPGLMDALADAQADIDHIAKTGENVFHKYKYATAETVVAVSREVLHKRALLLQRQSWSTTTDSAGTTWVHIIFVLFHLPSREQQQSTISYPVVPEKGRPPDKALSAALTTATSYFIVGLLLIPREEEEVDTRDDRKYEPRRRPPPTTNATAGKDDAISPRKVEILRGMTTNEPGLCKAFGVERLEDMTNTQFVKALTTMEKRRADNSVQGGGEAGSGSDDGTEQPGME